MNKLVPCVILASLAMSCALSQAATTDEGVSDNYGSYGSSAEPRGQNNFFVAGQLGQSQARDSFLTDKNDVFSNVRFGWRWRGMLGPEIGFTYLGESKSVANLPGGKFAGSYSQNAYAFTLGLNGKYNVLGGLFVTAHGGYLYSRTEANWKVTSSVPLVLSQEGGWTRYNGGWYAGVGVGYDLTRNFSVGINYDNYSLQNSRISHIPASGRPGNLTIATYSASAEYRF